VSVLTEWNVDLGHPPHRRVAGTLLGPEGSVDLSSGLPTLNREVTPRRQRVWGGSRPSLENCTVDASIK